MGCERVRVNLSRLLAEEGGIAALTTRWHLRRCAACRAEWESLQRLQTLLQATDPLAGLSPLSARPVLQPSRLPVTVAPTRRYALLAATCVVMGIALVSAIRLRQAEAAKSIKTIHLVGRKEWFERTEDEWLPFRKQTMRVEIWYQAPDRYRKNEAEGLQWYGGLLPFNTIIRGKQAVKISQHELSKGRTMAESSEKVIADFHRENWDVASFANPQALLELRSPAPSADPIVQREAKERWQRLRRTTVQKAVYQGRGVQIYTQEVEAGYDLGKKTYYDLWIFYVDVQTGRVIYAERRPQRDKNDLTQPFRVEILDRIEYNVPLPDNLFDLPTSKGKS